jgi:hypothetical protein
VILYKGSKPYVSGEFEEYHDWIAKASGKGEHFTAKLSEESKPDRLSSLGV